ncbi:3alpha(or 20beta)-hydroxysteroid dehydrogenase [Sphingobium sp. OAS761]|uniref:SDR family NAD(P)-dependent oxidoreductase n=1 Tax=Sphingobium sp. OAS761 TaxID=2817901 RepID=UPI00209EBD44|nr:glucose 1-dehydrogenase [Sphingobium sp. OAS761]MCP1472420.1 3alpha(or 20beta)-hydroxysteroid dehydrogenase [Sphingobium sp. OAS761]
MRLDGKSAIVTGSARGLGASIARDLAREGARVMLCDILEEQGQDVARSIGDAAIFRRLDVTKSGEWADSVAEAESAFGSVDVLVNNAALIEQVPFDEVTEELFRAIFEVNALGTFLGMKAVAPAMRRAGGGSIVNISSTAGIHSSGGLAYGGSKFAITGLTKTAAHMLGPEKIRINSVHPGWMRTPQTEVVPLDWVASLLPLRTIMDTAEVAKLVSFLASDDSSMITGSEYLIDAGALLMGARDIVDRMADHM